MSQQLIDFQGLSPKCAKWTRTHAKTEASKRRRKKKLPIFPKLVTTVSRRPSNALKHTTFVHPPGPPSDSPHPLPDITLLNRGYSDNTAQPKPPNIYKQTKEEKEQRSTKQRRSSQPQLASHQRDLLSSNKPTRMRELPKCPKQKNTNTGEKEADFYSQRTPTDRPTERKKNRKRTASPKLVFQRNASSSAAPSSLGRLRWGGSPKGGTRAIK